jgi:ATP-dependent HslUV protease ATP-binding subunit HslU
MTKLLEELLFNAPNMAKSIKITRDYVDKKLGDIVRNVDVSRYIL